MSKVPAGWRESLIGDIANIQVGRDLKEGCFSETRNDNYMYPVYSNTVACRGLYGYYNFPEYNGNSVTIVGRGIGIGTAFAREADHSFGAIGRLLVVSPLKSSFDVNFFSNYVNFILRIFYEDGAIPQLPGAQLAKYKVVLPPLPEQTKIAQILSTWDKAIATTEQLIGNSQQQKKALMQSLLTGRKRLPGFEGEWRKLAINEIGHVVTGSTPPKVDINNYGSGYLWATAQDLKEKYVSNTVIKLSQHGVKAARIVPQGSVLVTCIASIGINAIAKEPLATNQQINSIVVSEKHNNEFVYYLIESIKHILKKLSGTTAVAIINKTTFGKIELLMPSLYEQQKIAAVLTAADNEIELLQKKLAFLKQEKTALMQQLLTGKRRVKINATEECMDA